MTINEIQDEIIEEFAEFTEWMDKYQMLIDLGKFFYYFVLYFVD